MERSKNFWTIYDSAKEGLINQLQNVQRLEEEGHSMGSLKEEIEDKIRILVENDDRQMCRQRLGQLRQELNKPKEPEIIIGC